MCGFPTTKKFAFFPFFSEDKGCRSNSIQEPQSWMYKMPFSNKTISWKAIFPLRFFIHVSYGKM